MLSESDEEFLADWETRRLRIGGGFKQKLILGLPFASFFGGGILLAFFLVFFFFKDWYAKLQISGIGELLTILVAVFIIICFVAFLRASFIYEMNETAYKELKEKKGTKCDAAN